MVFLYAVDWLPTFGFLPVIPVITVTSVVFIVVSLLQSSMQTKGGLSWKPSSKRIRITKKTISAFPAFGILFMLGMDYWSWGSTAPFLLGFPWWVWYFVGLNGLLIVAMAVFLRY